MSDAEAALGMRRRTKSMILAIPTVVLLTTSTAAPWWRHNVGVEAAQNAPRKTVVQLTGTVGGQFTGHYICNGKRTTVCGVLPMTLSEPGISQCEFRKVNRDDTLVLQIRDGRSYLHFTAPAGTRGVRADVSAGGWNAGTTRR
jgi:hypothetical protein